MNYGQSFKNEDKIDPVFRTLINNEKLKSASVIKKSSLKFKGSGAGGNLPAKEKYECIVYTKEAKVLMDRGIVINSTFPTFVTAVVTLEQIKQMASMAEVTYIEAPKTNYPSQRNPGTTTSNK